MSKLLPGKLSPADLAKLKEEHDAYMIEVNASGCKVTTYHAPCCGKPVLTQQAPRGQVWDTMSRCPECGRMHIKITKGAQAYGFIPE